MEHAHTAAQAIEAVSYLRWIVFFPLIGVLFNIFLAPKFGRRAVNLVAPGVILAAFAFAWTAFEHLNGLPPGSALVDHLYPWITAGNLQVDFSLRVDALTAVMILIITGVGALIHIYSTGYMAHDEDVARYFTYLNLFTASMLLLVLGENLLLLFVGWEGVGLCSYLLIGFWYTDDEKASAGKKAFIVNRIGDAGFLLGMFLLFWTLVANGVWTLSFSEIQRAIAEHPEFISGGVATAICLLLFIGATGKSAQIPLYVWLPDAMAGPTPVSALIHAATMVTAGVYMIARLHFLFELSPTALAVVAYVAAFTAILAASIALVQTDIKKVLAYSTVSQLGYMFLGVGVGAYGAGVFHLMTHAFFKALLFLGAGSVIHGMSDEQDIRKMGGLLRKMPFTGWTFLIGCIAIAGVPYFSGYYSKDLILEEAYAGPHAQPLLYWVGTIGAGMTAFYMFRLFFVTFWGSEVRASHDVVHHVHESPWSMVIPLVILAVLSVLGGNLPLLNWLSPMFHAGHVEVPDFIRWLPTVAGAVGVVLAFVTYGMNTKAVEKMNEEPVGMRNLLWNKWFVDEAYDAAFVKPTTSLANGFWKGVDTQVIDGTVNGTARVMELWGSAIRTIQTGNVQNYAMSFLVGVTVILFLGVYLW
ncbi:MAG: NADH-quinone oxidoreductase subunit L [Deltaproteobacteria bacterium]|nr:NADH-quinone oxidoreductase subunit L [Deltaproteobacteria bacterium]